jgi:hypothetical protein
MPRTLRTLSVPTFDTINGKAQWVRVLDVFAIGPLMIAGGGALYKDSKIAGSLLVLFGLATIFYNGRNWYVTERAS